MLISILIMLKTFLYINFIGVSFNKLPVYLITSLSTILIISLIYRSKSKYKKSLALGFYSLVSIIMFADVLYYAQFAALPSVVMLSQAGQLRAVGDSIRALVEIKNLLLIIDIPLILLGSIYFRKKEKRKRKIRISKNKVSLGLLGLLVLTLAYVQINGQARSVMAQEFYLFHGSDLVQSFRQESEKEEKLTLSEKDLRDLENRTKKKEGNLTGLAKDRNLIVIQVEALQGFVVDLVYEGQEVSPNFNKLIKDKSTIYYDEYYQLLGRGNTSDTEFVSHNSLHPSMKEPSYVEYEKNTFYGLPWLLRDQGYRAWAFHGYEKEFWNREKAYVNQGFQRFLSKEDYDFTESIGFGLRDEDFFDQSLEYLKELDKIDDNPFYAFLVTLTSHTPYEMDEKYQYLNLKQEDENTLLGNYLQAIHYTDKHLGIFLENLKEEGLYDNSIIAIYGDHFAIGNTQEDIKKHMSSFLGEEYDFDHMMNIPLTITIAGENINEKNSQIGSPLDFYPTLANLMGYENKKGLVFGRDLNNYEEDNFIYPQTYMLKGSFLDKNTLFVMSRDGVYEHSRATNRKTKENLNVEDFRDQHEKAIEEINKSNYILENDFLKEYMEK